MDRVADLTLRDIWGAVYQLWDTPLKTAVLVLAVAIHLPNLFIRFKKRAAARKVHKFSWPLPKVGLALRTVSLFRRCSSRYSSFFQAAGPEWTSTVIEAPNIFSHLRDESLLPPGANATEVSRVHITCFDPATGVSDLNPDVDHSR